MAWAERATLIIGIFWALFVFVMTGGTQRPDLTLWAHLEVLFWCMVIPLAPVWFILRLCFGNRGSARQRSL